MSKSSGCVGGERFRVDQLRVGRTGTNKLNAGGEQTFHIVERKPSVEARMFSTLGGPI
jgi:hypothetical protein